MGFLVRFHRDFCKCKFYTSKTIKFCEHKNQLLVECWWSFVTCFIVGCIRRLNLSEINYLIRKSLCHLQLSLDKMYLRRGRALVFSCRYIIHNFDGFALPQRQAGGLHSKTRVDSYFMTCDPPTYERDLYVTKERHFPFWTSLSYIRKAKKLAW